MRRTLQCLGRSNAVTCSTTCLTPCYNRVFVQLWQHASSHTHTHRTSQLCNTLSRICFHSLVQLQHRAKAHFYNESPKKSKLYQTWPPLSQNIPATSFPTLWTLLFEPDNAAMLREFSVQRNSSKRINTARSWKVQPLLHSRLSQSLGHTWTILTMSFS